MLVPLNDPIEEWRFKEVSEPTLRDWETKTREEFYAWKKKKGDLVFNVSLSEFADWWFEQIKARDSSLLAFIESQKKNFTEEGPDNIQDKEAYYTNLALSGIASHIRETGH